MTFTCTVDPCTLSRLADVDGDATWALVGGWSFEADADETIEVPDADYLAFGYWNMIEIESLADVVPFYYGSMPYEGNVQALSGAATYNGNAAGGYEHKTYDHRYRRPDVNLRVLHRGRQAGRVLRRRRRDVDHRRDGQIPSRSWPRQVVTLRPSTGR